MKPLGSVIGNLADGYHDQDPGRTPGSSSSGTSPAYASSFAIGKNPKLRPMSMLDAGELVDRLLRNYPNLNAHDPGGYINALGEIFSEFPRWAGDQAIVQMTAANPDFPPTGPRLRMTLADIMSPYRYAAEWDARADKQIAERKLLEAQPVPAESENKEERGQIYDATQFHDAVAKHGRPIGVFETAGRKVPYRG
jgi:hypothetical protein